MFIIYLILYSYTNIGNNINSDTMVNRINYRLEYTILDCNSDSVQIFCYSVPYPPRAMTFSCTIGNSQCCHYSFGLPH